MDARKADLCKERQDARSPQTALIHAMLAAAHADHAGAASRIGLVGDLVAHLPIFEGVDRQQVLALADAAAKRLVDPGGLDALYGEIRAALPGPLREAAYALSCDVVAAGCRLQDEAMRRLEEIRAHLEIDPARAHTIERAARMRLEAARADARASASAAS